jgi:hypothetical protein
LSSFAEPSEREEGGRAATMVVDARPCRRDRVGLATLPGLEYAPLPPCLSWRHPANVNLCRWLPFGRSEIQLLSDNVMPVRQATGDGPCVGGRGGQGEDWV